MSSATTSHSHSHSRSLSIQPSKRKPQAQAGRDAAALAEWNSKRWVWVPHDKLGYIAGWIVKEEGDFSTVALESGEILKPLPSIDLLRVNPPTYDGAEDIADLTYLNEASVVHNIKTRYYDDSIYTYSGLFLVAVNPYKTLPIYSQSTIEIYKNRRRDENAPHVYAVAESAWQNMLAHRDQSQSILVTGESGAGKTENTKKVIQYLAAIAADPLPTSSSHDMLASRAGLLQRQATLGKNATAQGKKLGQLERQILEANPILEAFGNAQTVKNNNSSRFGKFVRIFFNPIGAIAGANIDWYLLEKSRVTARSAHERGFHIFFQLLRGANPALKAQLLLTGDGRDYEYLKHSRQEVDGMEDREEWDTLIRALDTVGFTSDEQLNLFKIIAAILHLGNVTVGGTDQAHIRDPSQLERICHLLGIDNSSDLLNALVRPKVKAGREWVVQARTSRQVIDELAALSKALYEKNFGAIVDRINKALGRPSTKTFIGVLDIAGFEIFETNGFEQLCINYTNEKLQQFFNHHMFVLEQEEYSREEINWEFRSFGLELQPTIDLIESNNPMGILSALDDASIMPGATNSTFTNKLLQLTRSTPSAPAAPQYQKFTASRFHQGFTVAHYAGDVEYRTEDWLDKNRDPLNDNLTSLLANSHSPYVASLFAEFAENTNAPVEVTRNRVRKGAFRTVGQRHKDQLSFLMTQLRETQPHFVRCIVPNLRKAPGEIDTPLVLDQLRCNGVLEGIRIARLGFPNRLPFTEFRRRFEVLAPTGDASKGFVDGGDACRRILNSLDLDPQTYQLGLTKVFFKTGILAELEERRDDFLSELFTRIQAACRKFVGRRQANKILNRAAAVRTIQRNARIYGELRAWPWWPLFQRVRPLLAAARSDHEMKRRAEELVAAKEKAEKEEHERERLQVIQMALEATQHELEESLASERSRGAEKEALLLRSKERECELEEDLALVRSDLDVVDSQLERALEVKSNLERRVIDLDDAVANSNALIATLQAEQRSWKAKEAELASQTSVKTTEWQALLAEKEVAANALSKAKLDLTDVIRERDRLLSSLSTAEERLERERREVTDVRRTLGAVEAEARTATEAVSTLDRQKSELERILRAKESEVVLAQKKAVEATEARNTSTATVRDLQVALSKALSDGAAQIRELEASRSAQAKYATEVNSLRDLLQVRTSDHERQSQLNKLQETEVENLRHAVTKATSELARVQQEASAKETRLRQTLEQVQRESHDHKSHSTDLARQLKESLSRAMELEVRTQDLERLQRSHDLQMELIRTQAAEDTLKEREVLEKERAAIQVAIQKAEDAMLASQRQADAAVKDRDAYQMLLQEEQETVKAREMSLRGLQNKMEQQNSVLADQGKIATELRSELRDTQRMLRLAEDRGGKVTVEHVRVLEEASRLQNLEMERMKAEQAGREAYVRTLERAKTSLTQSLEDLQHEKEKERLRQFQEHRAPKDTGVSRLQESLDGERKLRQLAEINVTRLGSDIRQQQVQLDAAQREIAALRLSNGQFERELLNIAASDHTESATLPQSRRMQDSRAANVVSASPTRGTYSFKNSSSSAAPGPPPPPSSSTNGRRRGYE